MRLRWRIVATFAVALGLLQIVLGGAYYAEVYRVLPDQTLHRLRAQVKPVVDASMRRLAGGGLPLSKVAHELARDLTSSDTTALVLDLTGQVLASGRVLPEEQAPVAAHPGLVEKVLGGDSRVLVVRSPQGGRQVVLYLPLRASASSPVVGAVQLTSPLPEVEQSLARIRWLLIGTSAATLLTGSGLAFVFGRRLASPLEQLEATCRAIARGAWGHRSELRHGNDEVGRLATAFDEMVRRLEMALVAHHRFVADAAHQLKTPVTALSGHLELMERGVIDRDRVRESYRTMRAQLARLDQMVRKLLTLSILDAGVPMQRRRIDVADLARAVLEDFRPIAERRRMEIVTTGDTRAEVDP
ncbi:MAG: histidine kinase dimerization/phospho-acceptor domain-containing protein, partial [bacterium]